MLPQWKQLLQIWVGKDMNLASKKREDKSYSDMSNENAQPKIKARVEKVFLPEKQIQLKLEALTAIRDVTGTEVERLHPLKKKTKLALPRGEVASSSDVVMRSPPPEQPRPVSGGNGGKRTKTGNNHKDRFDLIRNGAEDLPVPDQDDWDFDTYVMEHETELYHASRRERKSISKGDRAFMEQMKLKDEEARKRKEVLHDKDAPPECKRTKYQNDPAGVTQLPQVAMHATTHTNGTGRSDKSCTSRSE